VAGVFDVMALKIVLPLRRTGNANSLVKNRAHHQHLAQRS
jgi:hypothetical protein